MSKAHNTHKNFSEKWKLNRKKKKVLDNEIQPSQKKVEIKHPEKKLQQMTNRIYVI